MQIRFLWLLPVVPVLFFVAGIRPAETIESTEADDTILSPQTRAISSFLAPDDQITNEAGGSTVVRYSLVESGLSDGVTDGGSNVDADPAFVDHDGEDFIAGTIDDRVNLTSGSPAVDAGDNAALPPDRFDLDDDGDSSEPIPIDIAGMNRRFSTGGSAIVDMGASESDATNTSMEAPDTPGAAGPTLTVPFPNPVREVGTVEFRVPVSERVRIDMFDLLGRHRATLFNGRAEAGRPLSIELDARDLSSGAYFVLLSSATYTKSAHFVVVK